MNHAHAPLILILEDDEAVRHTLVDILDLNGFRTVATANGAEGLELARRDQPALIISDVNMPGLTGFELLRALRADDELRAIQVIIISAKVDRAAVREGMELGAADFITKPFTEDEVLHSVAARLETKELLDELDAFAHTVAHDLKNPLATLLGRIDLARLLIGKTDEKTLQLQLTDAVHSAARLSSIIDELLVLAGVRRQAIAPVSLDMGAIVTEAVDRVQDVVNRYHATIDTHVAWPAAVGHAPWVIQIWVNYLSNAAKYGGENPRVRLGAERSADGTRVRFWVQDEGPGLDAEAQAKMFVPFTRITTLRASGHGLGLSIVRRIAEKLGGQVGLTSAPGQGARFWFELPSAPSTTTSA